MFEVIVDLKGRELTVDVRDQIHVAGRAVEPNRTVVLTINERGVIGRTLRIMGTPAKLERLGQAIARQAKSVRERADPPSVGEVVEP